MSGLFTQRGTSRRIAPSHLGLAFLAAWLGPIPFGYGLVYLSTALGSEGVIFGIGLVLIYGPILSWAGLIPGVALHLLAWRSGHGGLLVCLGLAVGVGAVLASMVGPLALGLGVPLAAVYWIVLQRLSGGMLRAVAD